MAANTNKTFEADLEIVRSKLATTLGVDAAAIPVTNNMLTLSNGWFVRSDVIAQRYTLLREVSGMIEDSAEYGNVADLRRALRRRKELGTL